MAIKTKKPEVIIVDDEEANRILFEHALSELNIHSILLKSGDKCIELLKQNKNDYALVLLDIKMPGLSGFEVLDIIRKELCSDVPVILISAIFNSVPDMINGIEKGAMDLLPKPVDLTILKHKVVNFIKLYEKKEALNTTIEALQSLSIKLQERENRSKKITDAVSDAITVIDHQGKILFWNRSARSIFGYSKFEIINENILDILISERSYNIMKSALDSLTNEPRHFGTEQVHFIYAKNKLGVDYPFELTITAYKKDKSNFNYVLAFRNLTKYLKLEKEVKKSQELREANKVMREFVDSVSHEMRTPMNAILGISKMMIKYNSDNLSEKQLEGLEIIKESGTRLLELINDVLDLSKIDSGNLKINNELFNFNKFLALIKSLTHNLISEKKIKFIVKKSHSIPNELVADQKKIHQILLNLIGNSVKFTEQGKIVMTTHIIEKQLFFEIADTGIGISQDKLDTIFGKFVQVDNSIAKKYKGTGLGLHITKKLIELLGGEISVESQVDKGTIIKFNIKLPSQPDQLTHLSEDPNQIYCNMEVLSYSSDNPLVLVIDDNPQNAFIYNHLLEQNSFSILYCKDGKSGIKAMHRFKPDSVIVKLELSDLYGLNIVNEIINKYPKVQVIAVSEYDERPLTIPSKVIFIGEPINIKVLVDNLRTIKIDHQKITSDAIVLYQNESRIHKYFTTDYIYYIDLVRQDLAFIDLERRNPINIIIEGQVDKDSIIQIIDWINKHKLNSVKSVIIEKMNSETMDTSLKSLHDDIKMLDINSIVDFIETLTDNKKNE